MAADRSAMTCRFRPDGTLTSVSDAFRDYFAPPGGAVGEPTLASHPYPDPAHVARLVATMKPDSPNLEIEHTLFHRDGSVRWTVWANHGAFDEHGRLIEVQATGLDITEQRQADVYRARLAAIVAGADDAIVSKTLDGIITSWNPAAEAMFGYSAQEAVGRSITLIIPPALHGEEAHILARLRRGESIRHFETERVTKDGRTIPVSLSVSPVRDSHGTVIGASKIARDITQWRRLQEHHKTSVETLQGLYRLADLIGRARGLKDVCDAGVEAAMSVAGADRAAVLVFDDHGLMKFVCSANLSVGYQRAVEGHSPWTAESPDPQPILIEDALEAPSLAGLRGAIRAEGIRAMAFIPLAYQGRLLGKYMLYYDSPHAFSPSEQRLAGTAAQHISFGIARVQAEEWSERLLRREQSARREADLAQAEAVRANRAKDEFLAMLAHELRNPLGVITNALALLDSSPNLEAEARKATSMMKRQSTHLARLLDDLLDIARITSGRVELEREPVDLRASVSLSLEAQRHQVEGKHQRLSVHLPPHELMVLGDPVRLQQVLGNLVNNASKYTPAGGAISITLEATATEAVLKVRDDGTGIPADKLGLVFDLFAQANPTLARTEGGLGIGLTLVKQMVELHGGSVTASSEGPGRGAEFTVRLPLSAAKPAELPPPVPRAAPTAKRVLVIEDHEDGRQTLAFILEREGHEVLQAAAGREGLQAATRFRPDVALVDIGLPDLDGYEVARELRKGQGPGLRLIALTGYGQPQDRTRAEEAGFDTHLVKPIEPDKLLGAIGL